MNFELLESRIEISRSCAIGLFTAKGTLVSNRNIAELRHWVIYSQRHFSVESKYRGVAPLGYLQPKGTLVSNKNIAELRHWVIYS